MQGSLINRLVENSKQDAPKIGDGATVLMYTDRKAGTIIAISKSGKRLTVQEDEAERTDNNGMSDCQSYKYTPDPQGRTWEFSQRKNGTWKEVKGSSGLWIGKRDKRHDFSF